MKNVRHILIKSVNWVGDAVLVTPAIHGVRRLFPEAHITVLARPWVAGVFRNNPDIQEVWEADESASKKSFWEIAREIRRRKFDLAIALPNSFGSALLFFLGGVKNRLGYNRDGRRLLLTHPIPVTPEILQVHQVYYYLNLLQPFGNPKDLPTDLRVFPSDSAREEINRLFEKKGLAELEAQGTPLFGICPGAAFGSAKRWFPKRFAAVADYMAGKWGAQTVVVGSKKEREIAQTIYQHAKTPVHLLSGDMSLEGLIALFDHLSLFLTNDSGAMHVAAARNVPLVAVFGPTNWITTAPWHPEAEIVRKDAPCGDNPCMRRECPRVHACMDAVSVEAVCEALDRKMEKILART